MFDRLIFDNDMLDFLDIASKNNKIALILLNGNGNLICEEGNFIKRESSDSDKVSYLNKSKYEKVEDKWADCRTKIGIGRFVRKFLSKSAFERYCITDQDVEKFVNLYKSFFSRDASKLKIVEGREILKYYLEENYATVSGGKFGTLWNSCMRQAERNKFLKLYSENPGIKMLVFFSDEGLVRARALLWEDVREHGTKNSYKFMDRIYYLYDHDINFFKDWAKENGYITKLEQNAKSESYFEMSGGPVRLSLYILLEKSDFLHYPYLDTFKYLNFRMSRLSNSAGYNFDHSLVQSNGMLEREEEHEPDWDEEDEQ